MILVYVKNTNIARSIEWLKNAIQQKNEASAGTGTIQVDLCHYVFYFLCFHRNSDSAAGVYSGFLSGVLQLFRSAKILLKRLK